MYRIGICEDDIEQRNTVCSILRKIEEEQKIKLHIDTFSSGEELIERGGDAYDILILDVQMKALTGIETARIIRQSNQKVKIVFITALERYWPEGYIVNAYRYILKPINYQQIYDLIKDLVKEISRTSLFVMLKKESVLEKVFIGDIAYIGIENRKVLVHTQEGVYSSSLSLNEWEERLQGFHFCKSHASYLVNFKFVKSISKEEVVLIGGETIYVSQRRYTKFKGEFMEYIDSLI